MEILRRLLLILCTIAAISSIMAPAPVLYIVERPDFTRELRHHPFAWNHKGQTVDQYMEEETKGLMRTLPTEIWQAVSKAFRGQADGYLTADDPAIKGIADQMNARHPALYLREKGAPAGEFLEITKTSPDYYRYKEAPFLYKHPYTVWGFLLFLTGLLLYIFLPRRRFTPDTLCYGTGFSAVIGPDLVALMMVSGFFTLGLGVGLSAAPGGLSTIFASNLIVPAVILWMFSLFGLYLFKIAASYAGRGLQCKDGRLILYSPSGTQRVSLSEIDSVKLGHWHASKWVSRLGFLISLFNWRAVGPVLLNASRNDPQLEIHLKDGGKTVYDLNAAQNVESVFSRLAKSGVKMDSALEAMVPHSEL